MSISTYAELATAVASWLHREDLTDNIPDFIRLGELRISRDLHIRCMETALSSTIASGVVAVPDGYVSMKYLYVNSTPVQKLERKDAEWIVTNYPTRSADGAPKFFARDVDNFIFGPYPDSGYTVKGTYYKRLEALSESNTTNWFTENAPDLLLWAALCEAEPFMANDDRIPVWDQKYNQAGQRVQREDEAEEFSGSLLSVSAG